MSRKTTRWISLALGLVFLATVPLLAAAAAPPLTNWTSPATYTPQSTRKGLHTAGDLTGPLPFVPIAPCRQYNTTSPVAPLLQATNRAVPLTGAPCGIPTDAVAVAVNITIFNIIGAAGNGVFKVDTVSPPLNAWINYPPTEAQRGNAGVVSLNASGQIIVQVAQGAGQIDFVVDTNGYYPNTDSTHLLNVGEMFQIASNNAGTPVILGVNTNTSANSTGVRGLALSTTGGGIGVWGQHFGSGWGVYGFSPSGIGAFGQSNTGLGVEGLSTDYNGVWAQATNWDALAAFGGRDGGYLQGARHGVIGVSTATTGIVYGVDGSSASPANGSAGVRGFDSSGYSPAGAPNGQAGVFGTSQTTFGVVGTSRYAGVYGQLMNGADALIAYGLLGTTFGTAADTTTGPWGVFSAGNFGATGTKHFVEPHPSDPKKVILYSSIEGRTVDNFFRGTARFVNHEAVIEVPEDFRIVTDEDGLTVQLTPVGGFASMYIESQDLNRIVVKSNKDVQFHYLIQGIRRAYKDFLPVQTGYEFMPTSPEDRLPLYLTEESRRRLISNGTYNADGTVNMTTAERVGWAKIWADKAQAAAEAAKAAQARAQEMSVSRVSSQQQ